MPDTKVIFVGSSSENGNTLGFSAARLAFLVAIVLIASIFAGCAAQQPSTPSNSSPGTTLAKNVSIGTDPQTSYNKTQVAIANAVADGNYDATVAYMQPKGQDTVEIKVTVKDGTVTGASVTAVNADPMSVRYITNFNAALPGLVVGKKITELNLPYRVAGSSLTTAAFQQYVGGLISQP